MLFFIVARVGLINFSQILQISLLIMGDILHDALLLMLLSLHPLIFISLHEDPIGLRNDMSRRTLDPEFNVAG